MIKLYFMKFFIPPWLIEWVTIYPSWNACLYNPYLLEFRWLGFDNALHFFVRKIPSQILHKTHATQLCSNRKTTFPTQYSWAKKCSLCSDWDCLRSGLGWAEVWSMTGQIRALFKFFLHSFFTAAADIETQCERARAANKWIGVSPHRSHFCT